MKKQEKIFTTLQYVSLSVPNMQRHIQDWLVLIRLLYRPTYMQIDQAEMRPFSLTRCYQVIENLSEMEDITLLVGDGHSESSFHLVEKNLLEKHLLDKAVYQKNHEIITNYIEVQMKTKGLFAYIRSYDEFLENNTEDIQQRFTFQTQEEIDQLPKMRTSEGEIVADCNQFAGYDIYFKGFCLTACWRMYYSSRYRQIVPLQVLEDIQQVEKINRIGEDVLMIELYRDPYRWDDPINLNYQRLFRDQMGIDQLAWNNGVGILREPFIEYAYADNMIQTVQYQNERLQPTKKRAATHFVTRTYDLLQEQYNERRVKGALNARAYFPWVDEQGMKMMNYLVLNPTYSLDQGLSAYEFYLRNYLEINIEDEKYPEYTVELNIYLPDECLAEVPYEELKSRMPDIKFGRLRKRRQKVFFDLKKGANHLRVNFLRYSTLQELETAEN